MQLRKTVVLVGMMGSGKSAIGKALAADLGVAFQDSDTEIERAANRTISEIFARDGEPFFRKAEAKVIDRLLDEPPHILATGGGAFMSETVRDLVAAKGVSLFLDATLETLWERVRHSNKRPLLLDPDPKGVLTRIFDARHTTYQMSDVVVGSELQYSIPETMNRAKQALIDAGFFDLRTIP